MKGHFSPSHRDSPLDVSLQNVGQYSQYSVFCMAHLLCIMEFVLNEVLSVKTMSLYEPQYYYMKEEFNPEYVQGQIM